jgi:competence protein ComEC
VSVFPALLGGRLGGRAGTVAICAIVAAHLFILPLPGGRLLLLAHLFAICGAVAFAASGTISPRVRAALLGVGLVGIRVSLGGLPLPAIDAARDLAVNPPKVQVTVAAVLAPLRGEQRVIVELGSARVLVSTPPNPQLFVGDEIECQLDFAELTGSTIERLRVRGVSASAQTRSVRLQGHRNFIEIIRNRFGDDIERVIPAPAGGLAAAITIGLRERVDERLATAFTATGLGHIVALSGWNVAIVLGAVGRALSGLPLRRRRWALVAAAMLFGIFAGASPSVIRASFMAAAALIGAAGGRRGSGAIALAHAVLALTLLDPAIVFDAGFRLSALATAGLLARAQEWSDRAALMGEKFPGVVQTPWRFIGGDVAISVAAQAATLGVVIALFGRVALWSIPLTLLIAPLIPLATAAAVIAVVVGELASVLPSSLLPLTSALAQPATALFQACAVVASEGAKLPGGALVVPRSATIPIGLLSTAIGWVALLRPYGSPSLASVDETENESAADRRMGQKLLAATCVLLLLGSLANSCASAAPRDTLRISVLDVGQGDAILVETGGRRMLVDGGPDPARLLTELDALIPSWDRRIDILVASHPHEDHLAGLPRLIDRFRIGGVLGAEERGGGPASAAWRRILDTERLQYRSVHAGDAFSLGQASISVLWPDTAYVAAEPTNDGRSLNNRSIVLRIDVHGFSALLTGDIEADIDPRIAARITTPIDLLKAPHHGSGTSASRLFITAADPRISIVSVGVGNSYGHPVAGTIARLSERGGLVARTDLQGRVVTVVDLETGAWRTSTSAGEMAVPSRAEIERLGSAFERVGVRVTDAMEPLRLADAPLAALGGCQLASATIRAWKAHGSFSRGVTTST